MRSFQPQRPKPVVGSSAWVGFVGAVLILAIAATPSAAQERALDTGRISWPEVGSMTDDSVRLQHLVSGNSDGYLLRSASALALPTRLADGVYLINPLTQTVYNSALPFGLNLGGLAGEKGVGARALGGAAIHFGPVTVVAMPELRWEENRSFDPLLPEAFPAYDPPWYAPPYSANLPLRHSAASEGATLLPGPSSVRIDVGRVALGVSRENRWWGPGVWNALVLSNNAPGFPHAFVETTEPLRTPVGAFDVVALLGRITGSSAADPESGSLSTDRAALSAAALIYTPAGLPDLTLGLARSVYQQIDSNGDLAPRTLDFVTRWDAGPRETESETPNDTENFDQLISLFGRWVFPASGLEVYGEWARQRLPGNLDEFVQRPGYSSGYTLGSQWRSAPVLGGNIRLQGEMTYLEQTERVWRLESFYTSPNVAQGYTHDERVLGATIGPGGSSQWFAVDLLRPAWRVGLVGGRIRWETDGFYRTDYAVRGAWPYLNHDVTVGAGIRLGADVGPAHAELEWIHSERMNYLYQNWATYWTRAGIDAVDVINDHLRLLVRFR